MLTMRENVAKLNPTLPEHEHEINDCPTIIDDPLVSADCSKTRKRAAVAPDWSELAFTTMLEPLDMFDWTRVRVAATIFGSGTVDENENAIDGAPLHETVENRTSTLVLLIVLSARENKALNPVEVPMSLV